MTKTSGFTLVGVVVGIAILTILIAAVGPSIATIVQRDKEIELVFRGKQYARSIVAFQKRYGRYPNELKELFALRPRSIRQLWREPLCNCDDGWQVIIAGSPEAVPMGQGPLPPGGGLPGEGSRRTPGSGNQPPSTYTGLQPTQPPFLGGGEAATPPPPPPFSTGIFAPKDPQTIGPIVGVRAKKRQRALRKWRERDYTDEWRFIAGDADNDQQQAFDPNTLRYGVTPRRP
ncbi:MAG: type II secretion system protein [Thermoanaerobaculia bacterium]